MHKSRGVNRNGCHESVVIDEARPAIEIAVDLYRNKKVSLWKAAEIAGLCMEEFKDLLCASSIKIEIGGTNDESLSRLERLGLLELDERMEELALKTATKNPMSLSDAVLTARAEEDDDLLTAEAEHIWL
jgi:predicted HTH domain antitoxin